jgi:hypothetical protein
MVGAWGARAFENDDAMDWVYGLEMAQDTTFVAQALERVAESDDVYLEVPECCKALAAAEVIAALKGQPGPGLPDEVVLWINERRAGIDCLLVELAVQAVERVRNDPDSELKELWDESDHSREWYGPVDDLLSRLEQ